MAHLTLEYRDVGYWCFNAECWRERERRRMPIFLTVAELILVVQEMGKGGGRTGFREVDSLD
jgi:hypothetical protein